MFGACGRPDLALEMFTDLRRFDEAKQWAEKASLMGGASGQRTLSLSPCLSGALPNSPSGCCTSCTRLPG